MNTSNHTGRGNEQSWARSAVAMLVTACGVLLATVASGDDSDGRPLTKVVSYADLDLDRQAGTEVLYRRIRLAAREVCGPVDQRVLPQAMAWRTCVAEAIERAINEIDKPVLSEYHLARTGKAAKPVTLAHQ